MSSPPVRPEISVRRLLHSVRDPAGPTVQLGDVGPPHGHRPQLGGGAELLDDVEAFLARFIAYPSDEARIAHTLWIAHTWLMDCWESTPRIAFLSPEPGSGKSRALEVTEPLVPRPVHAVNVSPAYLFRKVSDENGAPTILFDEIDTIFGPRAKGDEDIRGLLNAGHRKGAMAGRCVVRGNVITTEELPSYAAVALAGLDDLPDTLMTRSVVVRMRRRAPTEVVEPWRQRFGAAEAEPLHDRLLKWSESVRLLVRENFPVMPAGVEDRNADVWEALLAVADAAGGGWPERARATAVTLVTSSSDDKRSLGILLLSDLRDIFSRSGLSRMSTDMLLAELNKIDESPWGDLRGKELDSRGLARRLGKYGIQPKLLRDGGPPFRGYEVADLCDTWNRYIQKEDQHLNSSRDSDPMRSDHHDGPASLLSSQDAVTPVTPTTTGSDEQGELCTVCSRDLDIAAALCNSTICTGCAP
jgi:hypothetical protein